MTKEMNYQGRIYTNSFGRTTDLLKVSGTSFKEIYEQLLNQDGTKGTLTKALEMVKKYHGSDDLEDTAYMEIINESTSHIDEHRLETLSGNWYIEEDGKKSYLRTIDKRTGEMTFWTEG